MAACRLLRCEAALLLALSASSPFLDGQATGAHSQRWRQFPITPQQVPLFENHQHYIDWMHAQLEQQQMRNVRHFWGSVRPNGPERPQQLNRVELRVCDLVSDPRDLLAITALAELRLLQLIDRGRSEDPLFSSELSAAELAELADHNDQQAALASLDAELRHWRDGRSISARQWIQDQLQDLKTWGDGQPAMAWLDRLPALLERGNTAMQWLQRQQSGESISAILRADSAAMAALEQDLLKGGLG